MITSGGTGDAGISIESPHPRERRRTIHLSNGEQRTTSRDALRLAGLKSGDLRAPEEIAAALGEAEPQAALERATRLLGHRERSRHEIVVRLETDGYPAGVVGQVVDRLAGWGYLDDRRFADAFIRTKASASWGRERISRALADAGVAGPLAQAALDAHVPSDRELDRAIPLVRPHAGDGAGRQRELARLVRKGFSYDVARSAIASAHTDREHPRDGESGSS